MSNEDLMNTQFVGRHHKRSIILLRFKNSHTFNTVYMSAGKT